MGRVWGVRVANPGALLVAATSLLSGCFLGELRETRVHTIDEAALLPVPIGPHALGTLAEQGAPVLEVRANHTFLKGPTEPVEMGNNAQYYLENVGQARAAVATNSRVELSLSGDYGHTAWSRRLSPQLDLTLPSAQTVWGTMGIRALAAGERKLGLICGGEVSAGTAPYVRRVHTEATTLARTTTTSSSGSLWDHSGTETTTTTPGSESVNESRTFGTDLTFATTTWVGLHVEPNPTLALDLTIFGQLLPVYPGRRVVEEDCYDGGCLGDAPSDVPRAVIATALGLSVAATVQVGAGMAALIEAHVHELNANSDGTSIWPGMVLGLRMPLGAPAATPAHATRAPKPTPSDDAESELERAFRRSEYGAGSH